MDESSIKDEVRKTYAREVKVRDRKSVGCCGRQ